MRLFAILLTCVSTMAVGQAKSDMSGKDYSIENIRRIGVEATINYLSCQHVQRTETLINDIIIVGSDGIVINNKVLDLSDFSSFIEKAKGSHNDWSTYIRIEVESQIEDDLFYKMITALLEARIKFCFII